MVAYVPPKQAGKYKAVASGAITNGKPVIVNSAGTVSQVADNSIAFNIGSNSTFENGNMSAGTRSSDMTFDSNSNKVVIVYRDNSNSNYGTAVVGTVSGTNISFGTPVVYKSAHAKFSSCCFDSNANKVVVAYSDGGNVNEGHAKVGTVSGTSISFGAEATFLSDGCEYISTAFDSNSNIVAVAHVNTGNSNYGELRLGLVSGTDISFGTNHQFETASTLHVHCSFNSTSNKLLIAYEDVADGQKGKHRWATLSESGGSTSCSFGSVFTFESGEVRWIKTCFDSGNNKSLIFYDYKGTSQQGASVVVTSNSSAGSRVILTGSDTLNDKQWVDASYNASTGKVVVLYRDSNDVLKIIEGTVSGTSISYGSATTVNDRVGRLPISTYDSNSNKVVIGYAEINDSSGPFGQANVVTSAVTDQNLTSENYIGIASGGTYADTAEATIDVVGTVNKDQTSLTAGQTYFVQNDGTLGTSADDPSVVAGTAISATELIVKG